MEQVCKQLVALAKLVALDLRPAAGFVLLYCVYDPNFALDSLDSSDLRGRSPRTFALGCVTVPLTNTIALVTAEP